MTMNKKAVARMLDTDSFYSELREFLENAIDEELAKDECEMDCELIDECAQMLLSIDEGEDKKNILCAFASSKKIIRLASSNAKQGKLSKRLVAAVAAVFAIITLFGTNAVIEKNSGINYIAEIGNAITEKLEEWGIIKLDDNDSGEESTTSAADEDEQQENPNEDESTTEEASQDEVTTGKDTKNNDSEDEDGERAENKVVALRLGFSENFKTQYLFGEELDLSGLTVTAVYGDSSTGEISVSDCTVSGYNRLKEGAQKVLVKYGDAAASFDVTVTKTSDASQKVVTGADGNPPTKVVYTTEDTKLDLDGIKLRLIYSDGTYSAYYSQKDITVVKDADFSSVGKQTVTVCVANQANYSFEITVERIVTDSDIEKIEFGPLSGILSLNVGDDVYLGDYYLDVYYKTIYENEVQKVDRVYLKENEYKVSIYNLDTSTDTLNAKTFTVGYKGAFTTVKYTVSYKRHVLSAEIVNGDFKRIYYKGESFCYDLGAQANSKLYSLASCKLDFSAFDNKGVLEQLFRGYSPKIKITYIENSSETVSFSACTYSGYDPYKEGYQKIDIYRNGTYLMSYIVFVYGNNCYVPISVANYQLTDGQSLVKGTLAVVNNDGSVTNCSNINYFLKAGSNAAVGTEKYSCLRYLSKNGVYGKLTAYAEVSDGTVYSYEVNNLRGIKKAEIYSSSSDTPRINLNSLTSHDFGGDKLIITFNDNSIETLPLNSAKKYYAFINGSTSSVQPLTSLTQIDGAYGYVYFASDNENYALTPVAKYVYYYR